MLWDESIECSETSWLCNFGARLVGSTVPRVVDLGSLNSEGWSERRAPTWRMVSFWLVGGEVLPLEWEVLRWSFILGGFTTTLLPFFLAPGALFFRKAGR